MLAGVEVNAFRPAPFQAGNPVVDRLKFTIKAAGSGVSTVIYVAAALFTTLLSLATGFQIASLERARISTWKSAHESAVECKAHGYGIISPAVAEQALANAAAAKDGTKPGIVPTKMQGLLKRTIEAADDCLFKSILQSGEKGQIFKVAVAALIGLSALTGGLEPASASILAGMLGGGLRNLGWKGSAAALGLAYCPAFPQLAWEATKGFAGGVHFVASQLNTAAAQVGEFNTLIRRLIPSGGGDVPNNVLTPPPSPEASFVASAVSWALAPVSHTVSLAFSALGHGIAGLAANFWFPLLGMGFKTVITQPALGGLLALDGCIYLVGFRSNQWWRPHRLAWRAFRNTIMAPFTGVWMCINVVPGGRWVTNTISEYVNEGWKLQTINGIQYRVRTVREDVLEGGSLKPKIGSDGRVETHLVKQWQHQVNGQWEPCVSPEDNAKPDRGSSRRVPIIGGSGGSSGVPTTGHPPSGSSPGSPPSSP